MSREADAAPPPQLLNIVDSTLIQTPLHLNYTVGSSLPYLDSNSPNQAFISKHHPPYTVRYQLPELANQMYAVFTNTEFQLIIKLQHSKKASPNEVLLTKEHMSFLGIKEGGKVEVGSVTEDLSDMVASQISFKAYSPKFEDTGSAHDIETSVELGTELERKVQRKLLDEFVHIGQKICVSSNKKLVMLVVISVMKQDAKLKLGGIDSKTILRIEKFDKAEIFRPGVNPDDLAPDLRRNGVLGMRLIFKQLVDVFKIKLLPHDMKLRLGLEFVPAILLHGKRGLGKTFAVEQLCKIILCVTPQVLPSPALESDIEALYKAPKNDLLEYGTGSPLHVIILDDIDINKLYRISSLPNLLVLATANTESTDLTHLRNVFETCIRVSLPERQERMEILEQQIELFGDQIVRGLNISDIVDLTEGFTRLDIPSLCKRAFRRVLAGKKYDDLAVGIGRLGIGLSHFEEVIEQIQIAPPN